MGPEMNPHRNFTKGTIEITLLRRNFFWWGLRVFLEITHETQCVVQGEYWVSHLITRVYPSLNTGLGSYNTGIYVFYHVPLRLLSWDFTSFIMGASRLVTLGDELSLKYTRIEERPSRKLNDRVSRAKFDGDHESGHEPKIGTRVSYQICTFSHF